MMQQQAMNRELPVPYAPGLTPSDYEKPEQVAPA